MIRTGLIGTGGISGVHLRYMRSRDDVEIAALCDIKPEALENRRSEFGGRGFDHFMKMLDAVKLDAVWLCTPPEVRQEMLVECAGRGIPVFCEKPVERTEEKAAQIASELKKRKAHVTIGYVFRALPIVRKLRVLMEDDRIHLVQSFYGCNMSIKRDFPDWFFDKDRSGGGLVDQATHNFDMLRYLFGKVKEVTGSASNPYKKKTPGYTIDETIGLTFIFENGMLGTHSHTWVGDAWRNYLAFSGEKRHYGLDMCKLEITVLEGSTTTLIEAEQDGMYTYENALFLEMVRSGDWSNNICDYADGFETLRLTLAADRSITDGKVML